MNTALRRNKNFALLLSGQIVSNAGDHIQDFAFLLLVLAMTGSAAQSGLVLGVNTAAYLLVGLAAGALVDRWDRRRTMIWCELGRAALAASVAAALWMDRLTLPHLYAVAALGGVLHALFQSASTAALPTIVGPAQLARALAVTQGTLNTLRVSGATLAAAVHGLGRTVPFAVNAVSFVASAASLRLMRASFQEETRPPGPGSLVAEIREGLTWLWRQPVIRLFGLLQTGDMLRYGAGYLVIITLAQGVGASPQQIGLIFSAAAAGSLLGSLLAARLAARFPIGRLAAAMLWVEALVFPLYAAAPDALLLGLVAFAESVLPPVYSVAMTSHRLAITPDHLRGRTSAALETLTMGALSAGTMAGGAMIAAWGPKPATLTLAAWLLLLAITATAAPSVRRIR
ncbi:MFS transporter [Nonomuraea harbinensis]|uniref:MFS transporter n=1 Tax=Nonomuraea harbinensis TaxID=1286938 RepID=A0ABW1BNY8_9ACTN|nr:MFS transporter [Nonomuraea harbinensis]